MNKIPKIKINKPLNKDFIDGVIYESNLQEVNDFYDKYKHSPILFADHYPKEWKKIKEIDVGIEIYSKFYEILHDYLYKVE